MKKLIATTFAATALSMAATSALATNSDYSEEVQDIRISVSALESQLDSMGVDYNSSEIESGLNRSQQVKALEAKYDSLHAIFQNNHVAN
jgi:surface antigen